MKRQLKTLTQKPDRAMIRLMTLAAAGIIALLPFHAFLTVWGASLVGHYTLVRLWKELLLCGLILGCVYLIMRTAKKPFSPKRAFDRWPLQGLMIAYIVLLLASALNAYLMGFVTVKAVLFGLVLDSRFLLFFLIVWWLSRRSDRILRHWKRLLLIPAAIVICFGLLQATVLPADFLRHFGYGPHTIDSVQTIDQKASYQRIQSTMRGANPLGAYLVLIIAAVSGLLVGMTSRQSDNVNAGRGRKIGLALYAAAAATALAYTFSRSAWIGTLVALVCLLWWSLRGLRGRRILLSTAAVAIVVLAAVGYGLRDNDFIQNSLFHTDENSQSSISSNQGHFDAGRQGLLDIADQPFGSGVGTAGPASVYNDGKVRLAENYYIQIGQETGLIGAGLFVGICLATGRALWLRRGQTRLATVLVASLAGIGAVNLLSHAWTDDTLAYVWWGLAGAVVAIPLATKQAYTGNNNGKD